jgi:hypothetical protein
MLKKHVATFLIGLILINSNVFASTPDTTKVKVEKQGDSGSDSYQKIIDDYKEYIAGIGQEIRGEIVAYRKEIAKINKQKREIYRKLSQEAQGYLAKEQEYKKKLPLKQKKLIDINTAEEKVNKTAKGS